MKYNFRPYLNPVFIETGTADGCGVKAALKCRFPLVYSIELSQQYFERAVFMFCKRKRRVKLYQGASQEMLPIILSKIDKRCTFWLDAHYCGGLSGGQGVPIPIMQELQAIKNHHIKTHTILIDDIRLLRTREEPDCKDFPYSIEDIENFIYSINPKYKITYDFGIVENDILVAQTNEYDDFDV